MTKQMITSYTALLCVAVVIATVGIMTAHASEVTGTLTSDTSSNSQTSGDIEGSVSSDPETSGNIEGTVVSDSSGGSSGGGGGSRISLSSDSDDTDDSSDEPSGAVLGAATDNPQAPGFPNAGSAPTQENSVTPWSVLITFLKNAIPF